MNAFDFVWFVGMLIMLWVIYMAWRDYKKEKEERKRDLLTLETRRQAREARARDRELERLRSIPKPTPIVGVNTVPPMVKRPARVNTPVTFNEFHPAPKK